MPIRIIAADFAFVGVPDTVRPGWHDVRMINQGKQLHMVAFARLDSGKTINDLLAAQRNKTQVPWLIEVGGINGLLPGDSLTTSINLAPGHYAVGCFVTDSTGKTHFMDGMLASLVVADAGLASGSEPVAQDTVNLTSYHIAFTTPPTTRMQVLRVQNADSTNTNHDFIIARLADGVTAQVAEHWIADALDGKITAHPPFTVVGATTGLPPAGHDHVHVALTPGHYLVLCVMSDQNGNPHFMDGMAQEFTIAD